MQSRYRPIEAIFSGKHAGAQAGVKFVAGSVSDPLAPSLRDALNAWVDAARGLASAIAGNYGPDEFNAAISKLNDTKTTALNLCDAAYR